MRKLLAAAVILAALPVMGHAISASQTVLNETALAYSTAPPVNLLSFGAQGGSASKLSVQVTYGSATIASQTFINGEASTATITVVSTAPLVGVAATDTITLPSTSSILGSPATAQITVVSTSGLTGACITIGANTPLIFCNGATGSWTGVSTASGTASSIASAINGVSGIVANWPGGTSAVVYASSTLVGVQGNLFTLASSTPSAISVSAALFSGGKNPALLDASFILNGVGYKNGYHWSDVSGTSTGTAASIAGFINATSTNTNPVCGGGLGSVSAVAVGGVVTLTQAIPCAGGNAVTLTANPTSGGLTIGSALFTGGQDNAVITIGGIALTYGTNWTFGASTTTTTTALSIAAAINANTILNKVIVATNTAGVVHTTGTVVGANTNYTLTSSTPAALSVIGFSGGLDSAYTLSSAVIKLPTHGFTKGLPVLYSGTPAIGGLTTGTTYFVIAVDANDISLATSQALALAGTGIVITSSSTQTPANTYTLAPGPFIQGPAAAKLQVSNDGSNWADYSTTAANVAVTTQTFTAAFPSTTFVQDFGLIDYNYIRYNVVGPTQGGLLLKVILTSKD